MSWDRSLPAPAWDSRGRWAAELGSHKKIGAATSLHLPDPSYLPSLLPTQEPPELPTIYLPQNVPVRSREVTPSTSVLWNSRMRPGVEEGYAKAGLLLGQEP